MIERDVLQVKMLHSDNGHREREATTERLTRGREWGDFAEFAYRERGLENFSLTDTYTHTCTKEHSE